MNDSEKEARKKALNKEIYRIKATNGLLDKNLDWDKAVRYTSTWTAISKVRDLEEQIRLLE